MTTTTEQIEAVARAIANDDDWWEDYTLYAERAISAMRPFIRADVLEEAAKVIKDECYDHDDSIRLADIILKLKSSI